ncbi:2-amino-4-hydroxy-6-hydroxymethyldihydropteridine diphosphokinase [Cognatilysobacter lacus]|uniref:2-amino-4-hydroxy-6-hydroxymethyldihydropteridine pyrophosphokinase n=1 Tax=Cognatilysobacter lacus TaxID=1643323 RepID=A0A5D8Z707_9GAMM|nr:2-amino-4-hydroxy-6-hydroxymethyldihydropteridine diphosphokinase [Lysobacter lacus]TZF90571.1 2-amino-4-hydroxy-6-hydroxymethyldihydropteridine diphosphokinase [Lysobacter lacus]
MTATVEAYVGLGANIGDSVRVVEAAIGWLAAAEGCRATGRSSLYRTAAWGVTDQPHFINAVVRLETTLAAPDVLALLLRLEGQAGRDRASGTRWGPRQLDLDLLLYGDATIAVPGLRVPHPHIHERAFVLVPLAEVAPSLVIPGQGAVAELLARVATADIEALR